MERQSLEALSTIDKARLVNEDASAYGTFAEIGAGQEVARYFFQAGFASQTIAKTMSAYDMQFSDAIYGQERSYVCFARVDKMLEKEYSLLEERLKKREIPTKYFVLADTVATGSKRVNRAGHGWVGFKFQASPGAEPSKVVIHVRLSGKSSLEQQAELGKVGVNLVYGCIHLHGDPRKLISSLGENIDKDCLEVDSIRFSGPVFEGINNRLMQIELVKQGLTEAVMFNSKGEISSPSEILYKKHIVATRGTFRPITKMKLQMLETAYDHFTTKNDYDEKTVIKVCEISTDLLYNEGEIDPQDFLARIDMLSSLGLSVLISGHRDDFSLVEYLNRYSSLSRALVLGMHNVSKVFEATSYDHVSGGILQAFGLFEKCQTQLFLYPIFTENGLVSLEELNLEKASKLLINYFLQVGLVEVLENKVKDVYVSPGQVCKVLKEGGDISGLVPKQTAGLLKNRKLYSK
jgi:hypothetical protein